MRPGRVLIGTSGYVYKDWRGRFYPRELPARDWLPFYAATFPDSRVTAVHRAPSDYPSGKQGDVLTVEFTVLGVPCLGLNGGPTPTHVPAPSQATQQVECTTAVSSRVCSSVVKVGDPEKPCIEHEGKAYTLSGSWIIMVASHQQM